MTARLRGRYGQPDSSGDEHCASDEQGLYGLAQGQGREQDANGRRCEERHRQSAGREMAARFHHRPVGEGGCDRTDEGERCRAAEPEGPRHTLDSDRDGQEQARGDQRLPGCEGKGGGCKAMRANGDYRERPRDRSC